MIKDALNLAFLHAAQKRNPIAKSVLTRAVLPAPHACNFVSDKHWRGMNTSTHRAIVLEQKCSEVWFAHSWKRVWDRNNVGVLPYGDPQRSCRLAHEGSSEVLRNTAKLEQVYGA